MPNVRIGDQICIGGSVMGMIIIVIVGVLLVMVMNCFSLMVVIVAIGMGRLGTVVMVVGCAHQRGGYGPFVDGQSGRLGSATFYHVDQAGGRAVTVVENEIGLFDRLAIGRFDLVRVGVGTRIEQAGKRHSRLSNLLS
jgi:hypothetical protein